MKKCLTGDCSDFPNIDNNVISSTDSTPLYNSGNVFVDEALQLCTFKINKDETLTSIIRKIDDVLCNIKNEALEFFYDDLVIDDGCIIKSLVTGEDGRTKIHLSLNPSCITVEPTTDSFIITASKYDICGFQSTTLISGESGTSWYNQNNELIGTGNNLIVLNGGSYYATNSVGVKSNVIQVNYTSVCPSFIYTKTKTFYKECSTGYTGSAYTYSKTYTSPISFSDAISLSNADTNFDLEGQLQANLNGTCIYNVPVPETVECFNVYLSNAVCSVLPPIPVVIPTPVPVPVPTSSPVPIPVPVACTLNISISNIQC